MNECTGIKSTLGHFIVTDNIFDLMVEYNSPIHLDNFSDHDPVFVSLDMASCATVDRRLDQSHRPSWARAKANHIENYKNSLRLKLGNINRPHEAMECIEFNCHVHDDVITRYYIDIVNAMKTAGLECIPKHRKRAKAGWAEYVAPAREKSLFWHRVWG